MNNEIGVGRSWVVTIFAICLLALGLAMLFAGQEMGVTFFGRNDVEPIAAILGAALVGLGAMNWIARNSALGGIYGRTVSVGNQSHFFIGAMVLIKHGAAVGGTGAYWVLTTFYVLGAAYFCYVVFGTGVKPPAS